MMSTASGVARRSAVSAILAILIALSAVTTAEAVTYPITGTATGIGGNGITNSVLAYETTGCSAPELSSRSSPLSSIQRHRSRT